MVCGRTKPTFRRCFGLQNQNMETSGADAAEFRKKRLAKSSKIMCFSLRLRPLTLSQYWQAML